MKSLIRRMLRVLGAMPAHVGDPRSVEQAARFVHGRLARSGAPADWHDPDGFAPLVVSGSGPILLVTYLDDADPMAGNHSGQPPSFRESTISGPGIIRKAGVVTAASAQLEPDFGGSFTLVIETDRHAGSLALEHWLQDQPRPFDSAIWEAADMPVYAPAIVHSASGCLTLRVRLTTDNHFAEMRYGGVVPDVGLLLANVLSQLVSEDHEVRLDGFYDGIDEADPVSIEVYQQASSRISAWLQRVAPAGGEIPPAHLAMGVFLAPGIVVRSLRVDDRHPYLPVLAEAVVDIQLVPGQDASSIEERAIGHFEKHAPCAAIDTLLFRPPVSGTTDIAELRELHPLVLRAVPGPNPASVIESFGIPTVGYTAFERNPEDISGMVTIDNAVSGARLIQALARHMSSERQLSDDQ